ncbi:RNA polymerase sigma factor [Gangjinia marincola]
MKEGDSDAFKLMVEKHKDASLSLAISILKDQDLAEDVLQDIFITVFQKIETFNFKSKFATWLYRIAVNTSYNQLKKIKKGVDFKDITIVPEKLITNEEVLKEENQKRFINLALLRMNADEALTLRIFYLSEISIKEISKITGFKTSKIKVCLHRGRNNLDFQLRQLLGNELNDLL